MYDYLVVGSGLYGAIFAHEAKAHGKSVLVVDKRPNIAGNIYTENIEGINVHTSRRHAGMLLAKSDDVEADIVILEDKTALHVLGTFLITLDPACAARLAIVVNPADMRHHHRLAV